MKNWILLNHKRLLFILATILLSVVIFKIKRYIQMPVNVDYIGILGLVAAFIQIYLAYLPFKKNEKNKVAENMPLLKISTSKSRSKEDWGDTIFVLDQDYDKRVGICLCIKNIGVSPILFFKTHNFIFTDSAGIEYKNLNGFDGESETEEVMETDYIFTMPIEIDFKLPPIGKMGDRISDPKRSRVGSLTFDIIYKDIYENKYKQGVRLFLNMNTDWTKKCINDVTLTLSEVQKAMLI